MTRTWSLCGAISIILAMGWSESINLGRAESSSLSWKLPAVALLYISSSSQKYLGLIPTTAQEQTMYKSCPRKSQNICSVAFSSLHPFCQRSAWNYASVCLWMCQRINRLGVKHNGTKILHKNFLKNNEYGKTLSVTMMSIGYQNFEIYLPYNWIQSLMNFCSGYEPNFA